jgi:integral membrane sensor domain MASE1
MISSTFGVTAHLLGGIIPDSVYTDVWFTWWAGDFTGIILITPLIIVWATREKIFNQWQATIGDHSLFHFINYNFRICF